MQPQALRELEAFFRFLELEKRASPHTVSAYRLELAALIAFCDGRSFGRSAAAGCQRLRGRKLQARAVCPQRAAQAVCCPQLHDVFWAETELSEAILPKEHKRRSCGALYPRCWRRSRWQRMEGIADRWEAR